MLRLFLAAVAAWLALGPATARQVTDLAGRTVELPERVERIVIGEGRYVPVLAILDRANPIGRIVGMMGDYEAVDPASYARYRAAFPRIAEIPRIGLASRDSFSIERALVLRPQVAIFGLEGHGPDARSAEVIRALEAMGTAVVFIDFRRDPLLNTPKSMALLGAVLGRDEEAAEFLALWHRELSRVRSRLEEKRPPATRTFIESRVGISGDCCETMTGGMMGRFVTAAGGVNIAGRILPGEAGIISLEYLMANPPEVYIGTAIGGGRQGDEQRWLALGAGVSAETARASLARSMRRVGIAELPAIRQGRAHAIWHHFYNSPFNVVAVQAFAKWLHPELFADLDPDALLREMHRRFQPFPLDGVYWTSLP